MSLCFGAEEVVDGVSLRSDSSVAWFDEDLHKVSAEWDQLCVQVPKVWMVIEVPPPWMALEPPEGLDDADDERPDDDLLSEVDLPVKSYLRDEPVTPEQCRIEEPIQESVVVTEEPLVEEPSQEEPEEMNVEEPEPVIEEPVVKEAEPVVEAPQEPEEIKTPVEEAPPREEKPEEGSPGKMDEPPVVKKRRRRPYVRRVTPENKLGQFLKKTPSHFELPETTAEDDVTVSKYQEFLASFSPDYDIHGLMTDPSYVSKKPLNHMGSFLHSFDDDDLEMKDEDVTDDEYYDDDEEDHHDVDLDDEVEEPDEDDVDLDDATAEAQEEQPSTPSAVGKKLLDECESPVSVAEQPHS